MKVFYINNFDDFPKLDINSCTIGAFDGIHLGHVSLVNQIKQLGLKTLVITFDNLRKTNYQLLTPKQKISIFEELKIDYLVIINFEFIQKVLFTDFIEMLKNLNVKNIICGDNFRFGYNREGDISKLKEHFKVTVTDYTICDSTQISTTIIKQLIYNGDIENANKLLGREYKIIGEVIHGSKLGRKLGFATANINYSNYLLPKRGVYVGKIKYNDNYYIGMINIGHNPTLNHQKELRLEVHILNFNEEIYGKELEVAFLNFIREEQKFNSSKELIEKLNEDYNICKKYLDIL